MPMLILFKLLKFRQVLRHFPIRKPFTIAAVIAHRQRKEVIPHNATNIQLVVQTLQVSIMKKFMFCISHGYQGISLFNPYSVGRKPTRNLAVTLNISAQTDTLIILHFTTNVNAFSTKVWSN